MPQNTTEHDDLRKTPPVSQNPQKNVRTKNTGLCGTTGTKHVPVTAMVGGSRNERKNYAKEAANVISNPLPGKLRGVLLPAAPAAENDRTTRVSSVTFNMNPESVQHIRTALFQLKRLRGSCGS